MGIVSRRVTAALLMAGLAFPANARAAEPSYDDHVAQLKAGKVDIDYTALRMAYAASPRYEPYGGARVQLGQMKKAYVAGDCADATAQARQVLESNAVQIDAHMVTGLCEKKAGHDAEAQREFAVYRGLVKSVLASGDGKSPQTAFVVIAIDEEYSVLGALGLVLVKQALINQGSSAFDRLEAKKPDSDQSVTLYFNVDRPQAQLARMLQPKPAERNP